ncbi:helix-turn-helix domain-containing protein [Microvirga pudoricolor]|uniref:helix-turn-helix domain-containing protein n=1 Tax=Microvirga pudoricolor TaxID=2778729 RepID=UPI0019500D20|nr:helix-turn-helix domain-containing protein [Microvirga pudoricolor]MBM6593959.1 helix-turn-helix domain-containing protein [Microvirga pudoricolor]
MSKSTDVKELDVEKLRVNEKKWGKSLMAAGWNAIPNVIIEKQEALGLDALDMNIIIHLSHYWWRSDNLPHPSVETIAKAIGVKPRTIQKRVKALQELGLITRHERRHTKRGSDTNLYSFEGLIKAAQPFAEEKLDEIKKNTEAKRERLSRKKPKLVVNNDKE